MVQNISRKPREEDKELIITRDINAPVERVWQAWTDPKQVAKWWGPNGFSTTIEIMDVRPGGIWQHVMKGPDGTEYPNKSIFKEVVKHERITYVHSGSKKGGKAIGFECSWIFKSLPGNKTRVTICQVHPSQADRDRIVKEFKADEGGNQTLARYAGFVETVPSVTVERLINAPAETIWKALTDATQMKQWYFDVPEFRAEPGFIFQFTGGKEGKKYVHHCKVTEAAPLKKLAYNWRFEGYSGESLVTFELFPEGKVTRVKVTHTGIDTFPVDSNPDFASCNFLEGWTFIMEQSLKKFVEQPAADADRSFTISRTFNAPRNVVWKAWTVPELIAKWFGPKGFTTGKYSLDFRPNGTYHYSMVAPDGSVMWGKFVYQEIVDNEKIVFMNHFSDEQGGITRHPFSPTWPLQMLSTVTFSGDKNKTTVMVHWTPVNPTTEELNTFISGMAGMQQGWTGTFEQLEAFLAAGAQ